MDAEGLFAAEQPPGAAGCQGADLASAEEGTGSNPATPDIETSGHRLSSDLRFAMRLCRCPTLGAKRERAGSLAVWIPASSWLSSGTADTGDSAARWRSESSQ